MKSSCQPGGALRRGLNGLQEAVAEERGLWQQVFAQAHALRPVRGQEA